MVYVAAATLHLHSWLKSMVVGEDGAHHLQKTASRSSGQQPVIPPDHIPGGGQHLLGICHMLLDVWTQSNIEIEWTEKVTFDFNYYTASVTIKIGSRCYRNLVPDPQQATVAGKLPFNKMKPSAGPVLTDSCGKKGGEEGKSREKEGPPTLESQLPENINRVPVRCLLQVHNTQNWSSSILLKTDVLFRLLHRGLP